MTGLARWTLLLMIPLDLLLTAWAWMGRFVFGVGGWFLLIFLFTLVPVLLIAFAVSSVLALTQHGRSLTPLQTWAQLATWVGVLGFGAFCPDFGDTDDSHISLLTQVFGRSDAALDVSYAVTGAFAVVAVAGYAVLLGALTLGRRRRPDTPVAGPAYPSATMGT